jgi:hypothetical protein
MMPFQNMNPNYFAWQNQYLQPQQNPYLQRMENLQQFQQTLQPQAQIPALGKVVDSIDAVKATDIPMDGNMYYFPTADGNTVFGKRWLPNGQTQILAFKPVLEDNPNNSPSNGEKIEISAFSEVLDGIQSELKNLSEKVDRLNKAKQTKKESGTDE